MKLFNLANALQFCQLGDFIENLAYNILFAQLSL